ncbi:hypothetical protein H5410_007001 [Solanum commersonii]|uniref:Uncharacterized protein n=1 Tax=Solanum commersonii TaxID=4109 RepID=A0A9J6ACX8_SOLCO|nr:hypothetical protein H5410_007001 [Solanum commersonii]
MTTMRETRSHMRRCVIGSLLVPSFVELYKLLLGGYCMLMAQIFANQVPKCRWILTSCRPYVVVSPLVTARLAVVTYYLQ